MEGPLPDIRRFRQRNRDVDRPLISMVYISLSIQYFLVVQLGPLLIVLCPFAAK
jgi:hypothetical protein